MLIDESGKRVNAAELKKKIVFYGASTRNQKVIDALNISDAVLYFIDSDADKAGQKLGKYQIRTIDSILEEDDIFIISVLIEYREDVLKLLHKYGKNCCFYIFEQFDICKMVRNNENTLKADHNYKYIHIFSPNIFVEPFYNMVEEKMNISEHLFIVEWRAISYNGYSVFDNLLIKSSEYRNILIFDGAHGISGFAEDAINCNAVFEDKKINNIILSAKKILIHSAFFTGFMAELLGKWASEYADKMAWLSWGGDCDYDSESYIVKNVLKKVKYAYAPKTAFDMIKQNYGIEARDGGKASYCYISYDKKQNTECKKIEKYKSILLGHSAYEYNNQMEGLRLLYKWKDENIKIYCPLAYGNADYRDIIIAEGRKMFGDKFIPMTKFMEMNEYYGFLNNIDIAVFPMTRMAAATTLAYLTSRNKKIYLSKEMINCCKVYEINGCDIDLIKEQTFNEFIHNDVRNVSIEDRDASNIASWLRLLED